MDLIVATERLWLKSLDWRFTTECFRLKARISTWRVGTKWLQHMAWDWRQTRLQLKPVANEGLGLRAEGFWLNGYSWMLQTEIERLQLNDCNQRIGTEGLGLKYFNWMLPSPCDWRVGAKWLPEKGCNKLVETEVLQRNAWDWRPVTEVLQLKTSNWILETEGTDNWQLKFCYCRRLGLKAKSWDWRLRVGAKGLWLRTKT